MAVHPTVLGYLCLKMPMSEKVIAHSLKAGESQLWSDVFSLATCHCDRTYWNGTMVSGIVMEMDVTSLTLLTFVQSQLEQNQSRICPDNNSSVQVIPQQKTFLMWDLVKHMIPLQYIHKSAETSKAIMYAVEQEHASPGKRTATMGPHTTN